MMEKKTNKKIIWIVLAILLFITIVFLFVFIKNQREHPLEKSFKKIALNIAKTAEHEYQSQYIPKQEIDCDKFVSQDNNKYDACSVTFDSNGKAEVTIVGKDEYDGLYVYDGTKEKAKVERKERNLEYNVTSYKGVYDGREHGIKISSIGNIKYGLKEGTYNLNESPTRVDAGVTKVYYEISKTGYKTVSGISEINISKADNPVKINGQVFEKSEKEEELIIVTDAIGKVCYSLEKEINECENEMEIPKSKDEGTYTIYYFASGNQNYKDKSGQVTTQINVNTQPVIKEENVLTISKESGVYTYPYEGTFSIIKNTSGGMISCESSNKDIATCVVNEDTITVIPGIISGTADIIVKSAPTDKYNSSKVIHKVTVNKGTLEYSADGYSGVYDGKAHGIVVNTTGTIKYGIEENKYNLDESPTRVNAGTTKVYYEISKPGYNTITGSKDIIITKANNELTISKTSDTYTYPESKTFTVTKNISEGLLSCESSNINIATCSISGTNVTVTPGTTMGKTDIIVKSLETDNYNEGSVVHEATVEYGTLEYTAKGYTGDYDNNAHGIAVISKGSTIKYGIVDGTYNLNESPKRTNAGTTTVYYQISKPGYNTVTGSKDIVINKIDNELVISKTSGSYTYPVSGTFTVIKNVSGGELSCESSNTNIATCSVSENVVTVIPGTTSGNVNITVKSAATINYNSASVVHSATINKGTLDYTATGYTGDYDGSAHGISVVSSGATIKYGETEGTYNSSSSPTRINPGTTKVYFEISKPGYNTVTGSKDIVINKANNTLSIDATQGEYTYPMQSSFNITENISEGALSCESSNNNIATCSINNYSVVVTTGTTSGSVNLTIRSAETPNYKSAEVIHSATVKKGILAYTAVGYTGTYDGNPHGISVNTTGTVKYGTVNGTYNLTSSPTRVDTGTTTVYFEITKPGYETINGSKNIVINKLGDLVNIPSSVNVDLDNLTIYEYPTGIGSLTCTSQDSSVVSCRVENNTIILDGISPKSTTINISVAESSNNTAINKTINVSASKNCVANGDSLTDGQYYYYIESGYDIEGWGVQLADYSSTDPITTNLCTTINNQPIISMYQMFQYSKAESIDFSSFDTSNVRDMSQMFFESQATSLDLSSFDTSKVTDMSNMFLYSSIESLNLSSFDTSNVRYMNGMFSGSQTTSIDLSSFDTSKVRRMDSMFKYSQATSLDLSSFNTSNVGEMSGMFAVSQATSLDLSSFDTSNVRYMNGMFSGSQATSLDLSSFDTSNVEDMNYMFEDCKATTGYARTQADANKFNDATVTYIPSTLTFTVKPSNSAMGNKMPSTIVRLKGSSRRVQ